MLGSVSGSKSVSPMKTVMPMGMVTVSESLKPTVTAMLSELLRPMEMATAKP